MDRQNLTPTPASKLVPTLVGSTKCGIQWPAGLQSRLTPYVEKLPEARILASGVHTRECLRRGQAQDSS